MTVSLEKIFFKYVLVNKNYLFKVHPSFFKNPEISLIYKTIYKYITENPGVDVPKPAQIFEQVKLEDKEDRVSKQSFKLLIQTNLNEYDEENFIKPKLKAWILREQIKNSSDIIIDKTREIDNDELSLEVIEKYADHIREMISSNTTVNFEDDDLGSDFDDAEKHMQDVYANSLKTGWPSLDAMLGSSLSAATLSILMGSTNSGKSIWLQNICSNVANQGKNVVYFTLEMSEAKVLKRIGSMRLKIPINDYDEKSKDVNFMKNKIQSLNEGSGLVGDPGGIFENKMGKVNVKFFAAGTANINDLENHIKNLEIKKGFKTDLIVVDYITLMAPIKSLNIDTNLYMKGKHLAESLRALAAKYSVPVISVMQVAKDAWNASDITLDKIPESKAIAETADVFAAIIRTEEMKANNRYALKLLKQRDGDFSRSRALFDLNPKYLTIENDRFGDDVL